MFVIIARRSLIENVEQKKEDPLASCRYQTWPLIHITPLVFPVSAREASRTDYELKEPVIDMLILNIVTINVCISMCLCVMAATAGSGSRR